MKHLPQQDKEGCEDSVGELGQGGRVEDDVGHFVSSARGPTVRAEEKGSRTYVGRDMGATGATHSEIVSNEELADIYRAVTAVSGHNFRAARVPVPSGLCIAAWERHLEGYHDRGLVDFLAYGWPVCCEGEAMLTPTFHNHPSADGFQEDVDFYIRTEMEHGALGGPYECPPFRFMQLSPLMTRPKKDSTHRRVIMDLSWPPGYSINDAILGKMYVDGPMTIRLPTVDYMEGRMLELGQGAYLYKTDLARGYRQLRVDPSDWPLLGFSNRSEFYFDLCPPFGLRTSALCMQRTAEGTREEGLHFASISR